MTNPRIRPRRPWHFGGGILDLPVTTPLPTGGDTCSNKPERRRKEVERLPAGREDGGPNKLTRSHRVLFFMALFVILSYYSVLTADVLNANDEHNLGSNDSSHLDPPRHGGPPICNNECLWRTGMNGTWDQDWDFARDHGQYDQWVYRNGPHVEKMDWKFQPSPDSPFLRRTSWKWRDFSPDCQVDIMTKEKLCKVLERLEVSRILFYGDSLALSMYTAFMNKLGDVHAQPNMTGHFVCDVSGGYNNSSSSRRIIKIHSSRDHGGNRLPGGRRGVYELDFPTQEFIASAMDERIVAIFNIGAHYHNFTHYHEDMNKLLNIVSDLYRHQDIYFFRSTSPGHDRCQAGQTNVIVPLKSYDEYRVASPHRYHWDNFEHYNKYSNELIRNHNMNGRNPPVHFLDIWNMTALRHDAHRAPADCLHFIEPGPVDWWNHLLFTYLQHMSKDAANSRDKSMYDIYAGNCRKIIP